MAWREPDVLDNRGDAARLGHVVTHYIQLLCLDLRAQAAYTVWAKRHQLDTLGKLRRGQREPTGDERALMVRAFTQHDAADVAIFRDAVVAMRIDRPWVPICLLQCVQKAAWNRLAPPHGQQPAFAATFTEDAIAHLDLGRRPRYEGWNYQRYVHWHIRRDIKHPPDPTHELEAEYSRMFKRGSAAHSTVIDVINHVTALLDLVVLAPDGQTLLVKTKA